LVNERFIARHMMIERIKPARAVQRAGRDEQLVVQDEPHRDRREARVGVEDRDYRRHVGATDRNDQQNSEDERERADPDECLAAQAASGCSTSATPSPIASTRTPRFTKFWPG